MTQRFQLTASLKVNGSPKIKNIGGIQYQVYPVVMLVEGVHHGVGADPVYYSQQVIEASAPHWNNMPVTISHPVDASGQHVMCNIDGTIRNQWEIGKVVNAKYQDGKLKADLMININLVNQKNSELLPFLQNGGQLEVSTGLLASDDGTAGTWNNESYSASIQEIIPDHLALLPNSTGACSWSDGCGVRFNSKNPKEKLTEVINSTDLMDQLEKVRGIVYGMDKYPNNGIGTRIENYMKAIYSDYFVYKQNVEENGSSISKWYKQMYSMDTVGNIVLQGDPVEVVEDISYRIVTAIENSTKENNNMAKGTVTTADKAKCMEAAKTPEDKAKCKTATINEMIANEENAFIEADREWLNSLNDAQFSKLIANAEPKEVIKEVIVEKVVEKVINAEQKPTTLSGWLETAPAEVRSVVNAGLKELDNKRDSLMTKIKTNERNQFSDDQLKGMDLQVLESIVALFPVQAAPDYSFQNPGFVRANEGEVKEEAYVPRTLSDVLGKAQ